MGITPIERLKHWFAGLAEDKPRPDEWLKCAACRGEVAPGDGLWNAHNGVVNCSDACADDWATDRAY